jgi:AcrR family transcriptional regulator
LPKPSPTNVRIEKEGLRERKRRETHRRIAEAGMRLFMTHGYEATTLDAIATAAGISRRTLFYYFKSKDDILLAFQRIGSESLLVILRQESIRQRPIDAVRNAMIKSIPPYQDADMIAVDRLIRSNEMLLARMQAGFVEKELGLFHTLCEMWPQPERRSSLRLVAMASMGALRLVIETWFAEGGKRSAVDMIAEAFTALETEI